MADKKHKRQLKNLIVDSEFQKKIIILVSGFVFLQALLTTGYLIYGASVIKVSLINKGVQDDVIILITKLVNSIIWGIEFANVGFLIFSFVLSTYFSHKIAGPLFAIKKAINNLINGVDHRKIILRKGDEFHDLANRINKLFEDYELIEREEKPFEKKKK